MVATKSLFISAALVNSVTPWSIVPDHIVAKHTLQYASTLCHMASRGANKKASRQAWANNRGVFENDLTASDQELITVSRAF